jgi:hypothetical protein
MNKHLLNAYVLTVGLVAVAVTATLPAGGPTERPAASLLLLVGAMVAGTRSVSLPLLRVRANASDMFFFCALILLAPLQAALIATAGVVGAELGSERRRPLNRIVFNLGSVTISAAAAGWTYLAVGGGGASPGQALPALLAAAAVFLAVNLALVALVIRIETGRSALAMLGGTAPWAAVACVASLLLALGLASLVVAVGPAATLLGLLCVGPLVAYFQLQGSSPTLRPAVVDGRPLVDFDIAPDQEEAPAVTAATVRPGLPPDEPGVRPTPSGSE